MYNKEWGLGTNYYDDFNYKSYGYPESDDPRLFYPDREVCSEIEFLNWQKSLWETEHRGEK